MKNILIKIKPYIKFFIIFLFFLLWNLFINRISLDEIWNFGFAHNIYKSLIPYKDFNMVITPLFPIIMSIPFFIFGSSMLIFHIEWAIILTLIFYLLHNYLKEKSYLFILFMIFPLPISFPSYNMFLFLLFLLIIKLEDIDANDYLIGFILACLILTKQTVGLIMLLPTLYYLNKPKKILKRFIGCLIPGLIFIIYLILNNNLFEFFNLCFLGLLDFANKNNKGITIFLILGILLLIIIIYLIKKDKKNLKNYYFLAFFSLLIPIFDLYHFEIVFLAFLFIILTQINIKIKLNIKIFTIGIIIGLLLININYSKDNKFIYPNQIKYFEYRYLSNSYINFTNNINKLINKYKDKEIIFISIDGYYFKIINNIEINYFDLINSGNWGYNGSYNLLEKIKNKKDSIFFVNKGDLNNNQTDKKVLEYVIKNGKVIEEKNNYLIYQLT